MKKVIFLSSLPLSLVLVYVLSSREPVRRPAAILDLQEYIGDLEYGVSEEAVFEGSSVGGGLPPFTFAPSAPSFFERELPFIRAKIYKLQNILIKVQTLPQLSLPKPVGFMLWFAHLGWYP